MAIVGVGNPSFHDTILSQHGPCVLSTAGLSYGSLDYDITQAQHGSSTYCLLALLTVTVEMDFPVQVCRDVNHVQGHSVAGA